MKKFVRGDFNLLEEHSKSLVKNNDSGRFSKFFVVKLGDGLGYASGDVEWFDGVKGQVEEISQIPDHCGGCKEIMDEQLLIDERCEDCRNNG